MKILTSCCVLIVFLHSGIIKKIEEVVIYHLKFAMYMHLSYIPKMCYTCDNFDDLFPCKFGTEHSKAVNLA